MIFRCQITILIELQVLIFITFQEQNVIVCLSGAVLAYYIKIPYFLVWHRKWLFTWLNKVTLCFCSGGSRQSLKVREVRCVPGDPAIMCPVLFQGSRSLLLLA